MFGSILEGLNLNLIFNSFLQSQNRPLDIRIIFVAIWIYCKS